MYTEIKSPSELEYQLSNNAALLVYFSTNLCGICKTLKPKVEERISEEFPKLRMVYMNVNEAPESAGQHRVFTVPVVLVFFEGKETIRMIRNFHVEELIDVIRRPYSILFS